MTNQESNIMETFEMAEAGVMSEFEKSAALMRAYLSDPSDLAGRQLYQACRVFQSAFEDAERGHDGFGLRVMRNILSPKNHEPGTAHVSPVPVIAKLFAMLLAVPMRTYSTDRIAEFARDWVEVTKCQLTESQWRRSPLAKWLREFGFDVAE
jgi:hypothetical protein